MTDNETEIQKLTLPLTMYVAAADRVHGYKGGMYIIARDAHRLMKLARACQRNAERLCNEEGYVDQRERLTKRAAEILAPYAGAFTVDGDPRGAVLKVKWHGRTYRPDEDGDGVPY